MQDILAGTYKEIAEYIQGSEGQCVLILGPELSVDQKGISFKSYFRKIAEDRGNGIFSYFEKDNLFSFSDELSIKNTRRLVKDFYRNSGDQALLELIARIRFPLIINVCPDISLNKVYERCKIPFSPGYFSKDSKPKFKDLPYPTKALPVIYNIFGTVEPDSTLILNHSKLYETIQYLLPENSLPENIENFLNQASAFILLGLKFDTWYYQLICHKLKLKEYNKTKTNLSTSHSQDTESVSVILRQHFGIDFSLDNPTQSIERLIAECAGDKEALRDEEELGKEKAFGSFSLFVSYAWRDKDAPAGVSRETVVDWAQRHSRLAGIPSLLFFRDHDDLKFGDSIDSFMTRIGKGKTVLRVISDKYLRSRYCMTEALRIDKYRDDEKRVFTIIWDDADLEHELVYRDFWRDKCQGILEDIDKKLDNDDYDHSVHIYRFMPRFINELKDCICLRTGSKDLIPDPATGKIGVVESRKEEFDAFIDAIIGKTTAK